MRILILSICVLSRPHPLNFVQTEKQEFGLCLGFLDS